MPLQIIAQNDRYRVGVLPPEEWAARAQEFLHYPFWPPDANHSIVIVVEEIATAQVVASWIGANMAVLEGLYITEEHRAQFTHVGGLLKDGMFQALANLGVGSALTLAQDPAILSLARKGGFEIVPGTLLKKVF